jgi:hypothetical protein
VLSDILNAVETAPGRASERGGPASDAGGGDESTLRRPVA